jgi:hypothetical protein
MGGKNSKYSFRGLGVYPEVSGVEALIPIKIGSLDAAKAAVEDCLQQSGLVFRSETVWRC